MGWRLNGRVVRGSTPAAPCWGRSVSSPSPVRRWKREGHERLDAAPPRPDLALAGADGASANSTPDHASRHRAARPENTRRGRGRGPGGPPNPPCGLARAERSASEKAEGREARVRSSAFGRVNGPRGRRWASGAPPPDAPLALPAGCASGSKSGPATAVPDLRRGAAAASSTNSPCPLGRAARTGRVGAALQSTVKERVGPSGARERRRRRRGRTGRRGRTWRRPLGDAGRPAGPGTAVSGPAVGPDVLRTVGRRVHRAAVRVLAGWNRELARISQCAVTKAPFPSGCESRPATVAPAGSSRSG